MLQQRQDAPPVIKCSAHPGCAVRTFLPAACISVEKEDEYCPLCDHGEVYMLAFRCEQGTNVAFVA